MEEEFTERYHVYQEADLVPEERSLLNAIHDDWNAYLAVTQDTLGLSRGGAMDAELENLYAAPSSGGHDPFPGHSPA